MFPTEGVIYSYYQFGNPFEYDPSLELRTQIIEPIKCYVCQTPENNSDPDDNCYTISSQTKPKSCQDETFTSCYHNETAYEVAGDGRKIYQMSRGCSKNEPGKFYSPVDGYKNAESVSTTCDKNHCNGASGKTTNLVTAEKIEMETENQNSVNDTTTNDQKEEDITESDAVLKVLFNFIALSLILI